MSSVLVIGCNYWGHGTDVAEAKKIFRKQGGKLSLGYTVVEFEDGQAFHGVDQMGYVHWKNDDSSDREPKSTEIKPKRQTMTEYPKATLAAANLATGFIGVGTPSNPDALRPSTVEDWERCAKHPFKVVPQQPGQSYQAAFTANYLDGVRAAIIWGPAVLLGLFVLWAILATVIKCLY